jgi:hypothetical protein
MVDLNIIRFEDSPIEITRCNWIIGSYADQLNNVYYEIHFCKGNFYYKGLLIDDTWSHNSRKVCTETKEDIYILYGSSPFDDFTLSNKYCYFSDFKYIRKVFIHYEELSYSDIKILRDYTYLMSDYPIIIDEPVLSVVTTVYNNAFLLEQTIQSVINQKCNNFEYIIKDACSNDGVEIVVRKYSEYGIKFISQKDNGIYDGMDQGFKISSGEYIQILNSDDVFHDNKVVNRYIEEIWKKEADAYCSDIVLCYHDGRRIVRTPELKKLRYQSCINHTSLALKKDDYIRIGGFDKSLRYAADCDLTIKIVKSGLIIKKIPIVCVLFRMGGASSTLSWKILKEGLICRYRYSLFNIDGYLYTILSFLKNKFL